MTSTKLAEVETFVFQKYGIKSGRSLSERKDYFAPVKKKEKDFDEVSCHCWLGS